MTYDAGNCYICGDYIQSYCDCGCLDQTVDEEGYVVQFNEDNTKCLGNAHVFCVRTTLSNKSPGDIK